MSINGLIKKFPSIYQVCNGDINKFIFLLRKVVYPYEHMDSWERFNETPLLDKKKKLFTANCIQKTLLMKTIRIINMCLKN